MYRSRDFESWHDKNGGQRCENTFAAGVRVGCVADCGARDRDGYYTYDAKGRLVKVVHTDTANNNLTTTYSHDKADNRTNVTTTGASS